MLVKNDYVYGNGQKLAKYDGSDIEYYHNNYLGSIQAITNGSGSVIWSRDYYPFGEEKGTGTGTDDANAYKFTGKEWDDESKFFYYWHRYYDPEIGRFVQVDPMWGKYLSMSPYHYTLNNPLRYIDPTGMWIPEYDEAKNIVSVHYEDGDTYENLYNQLGISAEEFANKFGVDMSVGVGITRTSLDITDFVFSKNAVFSNNGLNMNCFSSCLAGTGAMSEEWHISDGNYFTEAVQEMFGFEETNNPTTGTITTWTDSKGVTNHAAINVITSQNGTQYYIGRPGGNSNIMLQNSNMTNYHYPGFEKTLLTYPGIEPKF